MQHRDIPGCLAIFAGNPTLASRYGDSLSQLGEAWARLLGQLAFNAVVLEEIDGEEFRPVGVGSRVFVSDAFLDEIKTPPFRWIAPEIVRRVLAGRSPCLSDKQVRDANRDGGLNLYAWDFAHAHCDGFRHEAVSALLTAFTDQHRGFLLKELIAQAVNIEALTIQLRSGGFLLDEHGQYTTPVDPDPEKIFPNPHFLGITRTLAKQQYGSWVSLLFVYDPPRFDLRPGEQRFLMFALDGLTDADLAEKLCLSLSAVKKTWRRIYDKIGTIDPELIPDTLPEDGPHERGAMKKQRLLAYLRKHMEELRPVQSHP